MRDFDPGRKERAGFDQSFSIGGEVFHITAGVHPSVLEEYENAEFGNRDDLTSQMDSAIHAFLSADDDRKRWDKLRKRREDPLTIGDLRAVIRYLYEVEAELPTIAPEPSSTGRGRTQRSSAAKTSSEEATGA